MNCAAYPHAQAAHEDHVERLLDLALDATFPASDALALPLGADRAKTEPARLRSARNAESGCRNPLVAELEETDHVGSGLLPRAGCSTNPQP